MRKAPKRGHRVTNRTLDSLGLPASHGLLTLDLLTHSLFIEFRWADKTLCHGWLSRDLTVQSFHGTRPPPHVGLTRLIFHDSSPRPGGVFLKENYPIPNTHETAEPCGCSPAEPVVNGKTIWPADSGPIAA